jgi:hypothetical protein
MKHRMFDRTNSWLKRLSGLGSVTLGLVFAPPVFAVSLAVDPPRP